jgi:hypothetical protein
MPTDRERLLAKATTAILHSLVLVDTVHGNQILDGRWYALKWGCDTLSQIRESVADALQHERDEAEREIQAKVEDLIWAINSNEWKYALSKAKELRRRRGAGGDDE